ncbi:MAG TPA: hypothetical protein VF035_02210, partial [Longimicrobiales bacterium]
PLRGQGHDMAGMGDSAGGVQFHFGAHAVGLGTRVAPAFADRTLTEFYLTQPTLMGGVSVLDDRLSLMTTISLEGLTLERGELGPGTYGEGYIDRRHPHTYLHEAMLVAQTELPSHESLPLAVSVSAGRGFAPFGTDDPMMRPIVRFPVNHHLSQVLERLVVIGGVRVGPAILELATFNGNEPLDPEDLGDIDRFGDSWSARVTLRPLPRWELQASRAWLNSPEEPTGEGNDTRKLSTSVRHDGMLGANHVYGLVEWSRSTHVAPRGDDISNSSLLAEGAFTRAAWTGALRLERTDRAEEGRISPFRTAWPPVDHLVIGITKWHVASVQVERTFDIHGVRTAPFLGGSVARVTSDGGFLFDPHEFYGSNNIWSISWGLKVDLGARHGRMGRYGVANG